MAPDVALISPYPPRGIRRGGPTGVASYTAALAAALDAQGAEVAVVAPSDECGPEPWTDGGVQVLPAYRRGPRAVRDAATAALSTGAPVVHLQHEVFAFGGPPSVAGLPPALTRLRRAGRGPVVTLHQVVNPSEINAAFTRLHRVRMPAPLARLALGGLQHAVTSRAAATIVHEGRFAEHLAGACVVPHGLEPDAGTVPRSQARRRLELNPDEFVVLCFGFVAPYKGLEVALEAARLAGPSVHLVVAGDEHPRLRGRDPYVAHLRAGWGQWAQFTGSVPDGDVADWFSAADLALFPYPRPFSSSGALADALSHHTPVLLSPALAQCIGAPAACTAPDDPADLARRLVDISADRSLLDAIRTASATLAEGRSWPAVAARHLRVYEEVSHGPGPAGRRLRSR